MPTFITDAIDAGYEFVESPICADCGPSRNQEPDDRGKPHLTADCYAGGEDANRG